MSTNDKMDYDNVRHQRKNVISTSNEEHSRMVDGRSNFFLFVLKYQQIEYIKCKYLKIDYS